MASTRGCPIDAGSAQLSVALVATTLALMQSICARLSSNADSTRDDTTEQMLRGLMYLLFCFAAAGVSPSCYVFQLTQPNAKVEMPKSPGHWGIYAGVLAVLYRMVMDDDARADVRRAACRLVAIALRRGYADPITDPMRKSVSAVEARATVDRLGEREGELQLARACMLFLRAIDARTPAPAADVEPFFVELPLIPESAAPAIAAALLAEMRAKPDSWKREVREVRRALLMVAAGITDLSEETKEALDRALDRARRESALRFVRFSGVFADAKRAVISGASIGVLDARIRYVSEFLGAPAVSAANYAAFETCDRGCMAGDAEAARFGESWAPEARCEWSCGPNRGHAPMSVLPGFALRDVLDRTRALVASTEADPAKPTTEAVVVAPDPATSAIAGLDSLVSLGTVTERSNLPSGPIARIFATLGLDAKDARAALCIHLRNWRDVNAGDVAAAAYLVGRAA
jgi:hypothetical protein